MILSSSLAVDTDDFVVEHLTGSAENRTLLKTFAAGNGADGLEIYLKSSALDDEGAGESRTYLVKDRLAENLPVISPCAHVLFRLR